MLQASSACCILAGARDGIRRRLRILKQSLRQLLMAYPASCPRTSSQHQQGSGLGLTNNVVTDTAIELAGHLQHSSLCRSLGCRAAGQPRGEAGGSQQAACSACAASSATQP